MDLKTFRKLFITAALSVILIAVSDLPLKAEAVFLKDGSIINGTIVTDAASSITIRTADNKMKQIPRSDIMRILYTELKMGKIYIQKRDGKGIVAYMVDEDRASYTFRMELYSPEEFTLKRSDVLFMAEKNPSGLQVDGVVGTDRVSLTWLPPYDAVKKYNIYIKKNEKDKYELADSTGSKSITLKNLQVKTAYYLIVTSVDKEDYESNPSNELKITTSVRVDVQLKDGKVFRAYVVSEDKDGYIFRNDLGTPEDYTVKRPDIQYITERYPSALRGKAGTDSIELEWFPPYDPMNEYNIYTKKKGEEYQLASVSSGSSYTLKGLASSTEYTIKVTGVGKDKTETKSGNELKITTKNIIPDEPVVSSVIKLDSGEISITWNAANDPDGKVEKYRIYGTKDDKREVVAELKKTEYALKDYAGFDRVEIAAVDDKGDESGAVRVGFSSGNTSIGFYPGVIMPLGKFGEMFNMGYGGMLTYSESNLFIDNFEGGIALEFYYMKGNELIEEKNRDYKDFMIAPVYLTAGYNFDIGYGLNIKPVLSFGGAYIDMKYFDRNKTVEEEQDMHLQIFEPAFKAGIAADYKFSDVLSFSARCEYGAVIETSGLLSFVTVNAGIGYSF